MRLVAILFVFVPIAVGFLFPMTGGGGCCQQQQCCPRPCCPPPCCPPPCCPPPCCPPPCCPPPCCPPPCCPQPCCQQQSCPQPCCQQQQQCGCGGGGFGKRRKREIGHVRGKVEKEALSESEHSQCNNAEFSGIIHKHLNNTNAEVAKSVIYDELVALHPDQSFTVFCIDGRASYQADSHSYCIEGNKNYNCYVFAM
ncbi:ground-like domain protein [Dictyocaulus viviparus]|uniref:Ground-like domain protein n=1 Tax=Dictyocaulus viviparus TaxID=29172 RepID=A0A0D8Y4I3_DICVI|nr:ground-like domain protein [Dictyocaulus viviparus]